MLIKTPYCDIDAELINHMRQIKLLVCDVDGVLSDGKIYMGNEGEELKTFHTKDGFGIKALLNAGIEIAVITGRQSTIVTNRMNALGVKYVYQGQGDKLPAFDELLRELDLLPIHVAYIGDDVIDMPVMQASGMSIAVADAHPLVKECAHYVTTIKGGEGAVREVCDLILLACDKLKSERAVFI